MATLKKKNRLKNTKYKPKSNPKQTDTVGTAHITVLVTVCNFGMAQNSSDNLPS